MRLIFDNVIYYEHMFFGSRNKLGIWTTFEHVNMNIQDSEMYCDVALDKGY